jgi:cyclic beta-1,2-glucan synthetase
MTVTSDRLPPAPWSNVIANPRGGFLVSENGAGCTWVENAYFFRLTPWHNDPVENPSSDALYLRDIDDDDTWSATPAPMRSAGPYRVRHAPGMSTFEHDHDGIVSELTLGVPSDTAAKVSILRLRNTSRRRRRIAVTAYVEWTLGARRETTQYQVRTRYAAENSAIFAENTFDPSFGKWVAYLATTEPVTSVPARRFARWRYRRWP